MEITESPRNEAVVCVREGFFLSFEGNGGRGFDRRRGGGGVTHGLGVTRERRGQSFFFLSSVLNAVVTLMGGMGPRIHLLINCIIEERVRRRS